MELQRLSLTNFKGLRKQGIEPNGDPIAIYGDNETGKTTLYDAALWLLFGKDSGHRSDFEIKTLDQDEQPIHNLDHEVEAVLSTPEGDITLKKAYREKWTKPKGQKNKILSGHTTEHFVNDVPKTANEYKDAIDGIAGREETFKLLTNPRYFPEMLKWQDRRELLLSLRGDVTNSQVIESNPELASLSDILSQRNFDDHKTMIDAKKRKIKSRLDEIPARIDEAHRGLPDEAGDIESIKAEIEGLKSKRGDLNNQISAAKADDGTGGLLFEKQTTRAQMDGLIDRYRKQTDAKLRDHDKSVEGAQRQRREIEDAMHRLNRGRSIEQDITDKTAQMDELRAQYRETHDETYEPEVSEVCPTCEQSLPADQVQAAYEKAVADWNRQKSERLENIQNAGRVLKQQVDEYRKQVEGIDAEIGKRQAELDALPVDDPAARKQIEDEAEMVYEDPEYLTMQQKLVNVEERLENTRQGQSDTTELENEINQIGTQMDKLKGQQAATEQAASLRERIAELEAEQKKLAGELESIEQELYLIGQFTITKVGLVEGRVNSMFSMARFKMFRKLVNGGVEECCEVTYQGVPWASLNNAARINVGLDIINALSRHYEFTAPIFIDNAEAVVRIIETDGQQIRLYVDGNEPELRVQSAEVEAAA